LPHISSKYPIIVVIAGRDKVDPLPPSKGYRHFPFRGVTVDWYQRYAEDHKVDLDPKLIQEFHRLLHGRPKEFAEYIKAQLTLGSAQ
jgi:hypothetical protein